MRTAADRVIAGDIDIPEGWKVVEQKDVDDKLEENFMVYSWSSKTFYTIDWWRKKHDGNVKTMKYTAGMLAIRQVTAEIKEPVATPKPITRMNKSSFLDIIKKL